MGLEFYAVTGDKLDELPCSWLWDLVWQMSNFAAKHGGIRDALEDMGMLSTELYDVRIPDEHREQFVNEEERVWAYCWRSRIKASQGASTVHCHPSSW